MDRPGVGRNDACPCGSGRKFKKCCLTRGSVGRVLTSAPVAVRSAQATPTFATRTVPPPKSVSAAAEVSDDGIDFPDPSEFEVLPIEIGLRYTYPEPFGIAEVSHVLPAGRIYQLADGRGIPNDDLQPGMQVVLKDGAVGTIESVRHFYEPPDPPLQVGPGLFLARVVGTIKHKAIETVDVSWPGNTVTGSTDHKFYSVSRGGYIPASELQVGEILRTDDGREVPVTSVGERKLGLIELYNVEVEHFHNYHVGHGPSVLVHNGAAGASGYINTPREIAGITGFTKHGLNQAINRGVKPAAILDALKNPLKIGPRVVDPRGLPSVRRIGRTAEVVINPDTLQVVSVNPTSSAKLAKLLRELKLPF